MPIYNESANLRQVVQEWTAMLDSLGVSYCFYGVNDGSKDSTPQVMTQLEAEMPEKFKGLTKVNGGHGSACRLGYEKALITDPDWIFQIDSDGQCDPSYFPEFWAQRNEYDCLFGQRHKRGDGLGRKFLSIACRYFSLLACGMDLVDPHVPYRLMRTEAVFKALPKIPLSFQCQNIGLVLALKRVPGLKWKWIPIDFRARQGGTNSINYTQVITMGLRVLKDLQTVAR